MKKFSTVLMVLALVLAAIGCKSPGGGEPKVITLSVKDGNTAVAENDTITISVGEKKTLTAEAVGATSFAWQSGTVAKAAFVTGSGTAATFAGTPATIEGIAEGTSQITVTASDGTVAATRKFTVNVTEAPPAPGSLVLAVGSGNVGTWEGTTLTISQDDNLTLTATGTVDGDTVTLTSTEWEVTGDADVVEINETTGAVTVLKRGTTQITVTAEAAEADDPGTKTITLVVTKHGPDVIFEWDLADLSFADFLASQDSPATITSPASGTPGAAGDPCIPLTSAGGVRHPDFSGITLRSYGAQIPYNTYTGEKGFRLGGYTNAGGPRFVIGQGSNVETANTNTSTTNIGGQLNLSQRKVKVTVGYADIIETANRYNLRIAVNNNTGTGGNSSLGDASTIKQFIWATGSTGNSVQIETDATAGTEFVKQGSTKTEGELYAVIDPSAFIGNDGLGSLQNAFIMLHGQNLSAAGTDMAAGNWITITYIKIEYIGGNVEMPDPISLTIMDGSTPVGSDIVMNPGDSDKTLTATADPSDAEITWEITNGTSVTLSATTGGSTNVTLTGTAGITTIKVTATKANHITEIKTFTVTVGVVIPDDWAWTFNRAAWTDKNANTNFTLGTPTLNARAGGQALNAHATKEGVVLTSSGRFVIGSNSNTATGPSISDPNGQFDFSTTHGKKAKITVDYELLSAAGSGRYLRIQVNNNMTAAANTLHFCTGSQWYLEQADLQALNVGDTGSLVGTFDPTLITPYTGSTIDASVMKETTLKNSLICIGMPGTTADVLIKSVKVEYVDN